jgi:hypothetical protein
MPSEKFHGYFCVFYFLVNFELLIYPPPLYSDFGFYKLASVRCNFRLTQFYEIGTQIKSTTWYTNVTYTNYLTFYTYLEFYCL